VSSTAAIAVRARATAMGVTSATAIFVNRYGAPNSTPTAVKSRKERRSMAGTLTAADLEEKHDFAADLHSAV
jgi:hypothetical protein